MLQSADQEKEVIQFLGRSMHQTFCAMEMAKKGVPRAVCRRNQFEAKDAIAVPDAFRSEACSSPAA